MIHWNPETGETFKGPSKDGPWTAISREEFDVRMEHQECPLPLEWSPPKGGLAGRPSSGLDMEAR